MDKKKKKRLQIEKRWNEIKGIGNNYTKVQFYEDDVEFLLSELSRKEKKC